MDPTSRSASPSQPRGSRPKSTAPMSATAQRRRQRSDEILRATRSLFDAAGVRDAQIEDIARAVGINRAIIYRHFTGKEELFALTLVSYLDEIQSRMRAADDETQTPPERLRLICGAFLDYGEQYPAFVDCALTLLRTPGTELMNDVAEGAMFRLGRAISGALRALVDVLDAGSKSGDFQVDDAQLLANVLYTQALGGLQLARLRLVVSESSPGLPEVQSVSFDVVREYLLQAAIAMATGVPKS